MGLKCGSVSAERPWGGGFDEEWGRLRTAAAARVDAELAAEPVARVREPENADSVGAAETREAVLERLSDFRSRVVLVPRDESGGLWTAELGGLHWICAFSSLETLARFADARGDVEREWLFRRLFGARLLDELIPVLDFSGTRRRGMRPRRWRQRWNTPRRSPRRRTGHWPGSPTTTAARLWSSTTSSAAWSRARRACSTSREA